MRTQDAPVHLDRLELIGRCARRAHMWLKAGLSTQWIRVYQHVGGISGFESGKTGPTNYRFVESLMPSTCIN